MYNVNYECVKYAWGADSDLFSFLPAAGSKLILHDLAITSPDGIDGDKLDISLFLCTSNPTAGSGITAEPLDGSAAFGGTIYYSPTTFTLATRSKRRRAYPVEAGWHYNPTPEERIGISADAMVLRLEKALSGDTTLILDAVFAEEL
jgi:hypothetical protein